MGNDQKSDGSSSSSSSKKNKSPSSNNNNNNNLEKPKQPQRGLGVAQLEKIRLHTQMANCGFIPTHQYPVFPSPFPASSFQHAQEDMRMQAAYHQASLQNLQSSTPFCYGPPPGFHHPNNFMMGHGEQMERTGNIRFGETQPQMAPRWNPSNNVVMMPENHQYIQPQGMVTRHLLSHVDQSNRRDNLFESSSQNAESRVENEEIDLELKL